MSYYVQFRWGDSESDPSVDRMRDALSELDVDDPEHPDTWSSHESGWTLSVFSKGLVIWENGEQDEPPRHQNGVSRECALDLWKTLAQGDIAAIEKEPWLPGYGTSKTN